MVARKMPEDERTPPKIDADEGECPYDCDICYPLIVDPEDDE